MSSVIYNDDEKCYYFECPHCNMLCQVLKDEIKCKIFRHAVMKKDMKFIYQHAPQSECERLVQSGAVWGCGKPFKFDGTTVEKCGYI